MNKQVIKILLFSGIALILLTAIYLWFNKQESAPPSAAFVPNDCVAVLEIQDPASLYLQVKTQKEALGTLQYSQWFQLMSKQFMAAKLILKKHTDLAAFSKNKKILLLAFQTPQELQFAQVIPFSEEERKTLWPSIEQELKNGGQWQFSAHNFLSTQIDTYQNKDPKKGAFSVAYLNGALVFAVHSIQVESVVRAVKNSNENTWYAKLLKAYPKNEEKKFHLFVNNGAKLKPWSLALSDSLSDAPLALMFNDFSLGLELNRKGNHFLEMEGLVQSAHYDSSLLKLADSPRGGLADFSAFIPQRAVAFMGISIDSLGELKAIVPASQLGALTEIPKRFQLNINKLNSFIPKGKVAVFWLENYEGNNPNRVVSLPVKEGKALLNELKASNFKEIEEAILLAPFKGFSEAWLGKAFGLGSTGEEFIMEFEERLYLASSLEELYAIKKELSNEEHLKTQTSWMEPLMAKSFAVLYARPKFMLQHLGLFKNSFYESVFSADSLSAQWGDMAIAFQAANNIAQTAELKVWIQKGVVETQKLQLISKELKFESAQKAYFANKVVYNPSTSKLEFIGSDSLQEIIYKPYLEASKEQKRILLNNTEKDIIHEPLLFENAAGARMLALLGKKVLTIVPPTDTALKKSIPLVGKSNPEWMVLLPKEGNENPKILVYQQDTGIIAYDYKEKTSMLWKPSWFNYRKQRFKNEPLFFTSNGLQMVAVVSNSGELFVGALAIENALKEGYPIRLSNFNFGGSIRFVSGALSEKASLQLLDAQYGTLLSYDLYGNLINRLQLPKLDKVEVFKLIPDLANNSAIIAHYTPNKVFFYDMQGRPLNKGLSFTAEVPKIQYYNFGGGNELLVAFYPKAQRAYLYKRNLEKLFDESIAASSPLQVQYSQVSKSYIMYIAHEKQFYKAVFK